MLTIWSLPPHTNKGTSQRGLDESFFMVGSASISRHPGSTSSVAGAQGSQSVSGRVALDPVFDALTKIFEIASEETKVGCGIGERWLGWGAVLWWALGA